MATRVDAGEWKRKLRDLGGKGNLDGCRLTQRMVDDVQRRQDDGGRCSITDGKVPGLVLDVQPSGAAAFVLQFRTRAGVARRIGLGAASEVTREAARTEAERLRAIVKDGGDPVAAKQNA